MATGAHASCTRTHDGAPPATAGAGRALEGDAERAEAGLVGPASDLGALASHHGHAVATGTQAEQEASRLRELAHVGAATGRRCPHHPRWEKSGVIAATRARGAARARSSACVCCADVGSLRISETNRNRGGASPLGRPKASLRESRSERLRQHLGSTSFEWCECVRKARVAVFLYVSPSLELDKGWVGRRKETHVNSNVAASGSEILSSPPREDERRARPSNQPAHGVMARVENETGSPLSRCRPGRPPRGCPQVRGRRRRSATRGSSSPLATSRAWSSRRRPRWRL